MILEVHALSKRIQRTLSSGVVDPSLPRPVTAHGIGSSPSDS